MVVPWRQELVEERAGDARGMGRVGELRLLREGVGVQPVEQLRAPGGDDLRLRHVDVGVDEPRHQQVRPVVDHLGAGGGLRQHRRRRADRRDQAVADQDRAVLVVGVGRRVADARRAPPGSAAPGRAGSCPSHPPAAASAGSPGPRPRYSYWQKPYRAVQGPRSGRLRPTGRSFSLPEAPGARRAPASGPAPALPPAGVSPARRPRTSPSESRPASSSVAPAATFSAPSRSLIGPAKTGAEPSTMPACGQVGRRDRRPRACAR